MIVRLTKALLNLVPQWSRPPGELVRLIQRAHAGDISIEEFANARCAKGRRTLLVSAVADLLLDLRQQRAERAALEQEIRDRIANRTDALERRIGTLQLQAARDGLTGLGNRRGLDADLPRMIENCRAGNTDAALLMIDVDHFKPLNDTLGHAAGDQLLREIAQLIRSNLRENDQAYRAGGDEFVVLMPGANMTSAMALSSRLGSLVCALTRPLTVPHPPQLSIGAASLSELQSPTPKEFLHVADGRLYAVKSLRPRTRKIA